MFEIAKVQNVSINSNYILCFVRDLVGENGVQRFAYMISCGLRGSFLSKSTEFYAGDNVDYQYQNRN